MYEHPCTLMLFIQTSIEEITYLFMRIIYTYK
nr:MAG TPA: hypothetical protein [Caudoviricetes sp.]